MTDKHVDRFLTQSPVEQLFRELNQLDLCPVLDFRQSVEAIGLIVADYCAKTCDCNINYVLAYHRVSAICTVNSMVGTIVFFL